MFIHIYNKPFHSSVPDSKTAAYGYQSNSGRYILGQYRKAVVSKCHNYLDFADVEIIIYPTSNGRCRFGNGSSIAQIVEQHRIDINLTSSVI